MDQTGKISSLESSKQNEGVQVLNVKLYPRFSINRYLTIVLLITLCIGPYATKAQDSSAIERLEIDLWPEYDRSEMLVILRMQLADDTLLPTTIEVPVPTRVGEPSAVAKWDPESGPNDQVQWRRIAGDEWSTIAVEADIPGVWLEYYDVLTLDGSERSYTFQWPGGFEIETVRLKVQQPQAAESMSVSGEVNIIEEDGLRYHIVEMGSLKPSESIRVDIAYSNPVGQLTNPAMIVRPEETQGNTPDVSGWLPYVIGGFGAVMLVLGGVLWFRLQREMATRTQGRGHRRKTAKNSEAEPGRPTQTQRFCHHCGTRANLDDKFCRNCGTKLRQE
jgi:hypothetical protein